MFTGSMDLKTALVKIKLAPSDVEIIMLRDCELEITLKDGRSVGPTKIAKGYPNLFRAGDLREYVNLKHIHISDKICQVDSEDEWETHVKTGYVGLPISASVNYGGRLKVKEAWALDVYLESIGRARSDVKKIRLNSGEMTITTTDMDILGPLSPPEGIERNLFGRGELLTYNNIELVQIGVELDVTDTASWQHFIDRNYGDIPEDTLMEYTLKGIRIRGEASTPVEEDDIYDNDEDEDEDYEEDDVYDDEDYEEDDVYDDDDDDYEDDDVYEDDDDYEDDDVYDEEEPPPVQQDDPRQALFKKVHADTRNITSNKFYMDAWISIFAQKNYKMNLGNPLNSSDVDYIGYKEDDFVVEFIVYTPKFEFSKKIHKANHIDAEFNSKFTPYGFYKTEDMAETDGASGFYRVIILKDTQLLNKMYKFSDFVKKEGVFSTYEHEYGDMKNIVIGVQPTGLVTIDLKKNSKNHILTAGESGSGKSVLAHSIMAQVLPSNSILIGLDAKKALKGIYGPYGAYCVGGEEDIRDALNGPVQKLFNQYKDLLGTYSNGAYNMFLKKYHIDIPKVFVFFDEFESFSSRCKGVQKEVRPYKEAMNVFMDIAKQGRSYGWHILLGTQTPSTEMIDSALRRQLHIKCLGKGCSAFMSGMEMGGIAHVVDTPANPAIGKFSNDVTHGIMKGLYMSTGEDDPADNELGVVLDKYLAEGKIINTIDMMSQGLLGYIENTLGSDEEFDVTSGNCFEEYNDEDSEDLGDDDTGGGYAGPTKTAGFGENIDLGDIVREEKKKKKILGKKLESPFVDAEEVKESESYNPKPKKEAKTIKEAVNDYDWSKRKLEELEGRTRSTKSKRSESMLCDANYKTMEVQPREPFRPLFPSLRPHVLVHKMLNSRRGWLNRLGRTVKTWERYQDHQDKRESRIFLMSAGRALHDDKLQNVATLDIIGSDIILDDVKIFYGREMDFNKFHIPALLELRSLKIIHVDEPGKLKMVLNALGNQEGEFTIDNLFEVFPNLKEVQCMGESYVKGAEALQLPENRERKSSHFTIEQKMGIVRAELDAMTMTLYGRVIAIPITSLPEDVDYTDQGEVVQFAQELIRNHD